MPSQIFKNIASQFGWSHLQGKKNSPLKPLGLLFINFIFEKKMQGAIGLCCRTETGISCKGISEAHSRGKIMPIVHVSASVHTSFL